MSSPPASRSSGWKARGPEELTVPSICKSGHIQLLPPRTRTAIATHAGSRNVNSSNTLFRSTETRSPSRRIRRFKGFYVRHFTSRVNFVADGCTTLCPINAPWIRLCVSIVKCVSFSVITRTRRRAAKRCRFIKIYLPVYFITDVRYAPKAYPPWCDNNTAPRTRTG